MREVTYYPGCSLYGTAREYHESFRAVSRLLDIDLHELEDWTCCGSTSAHCIDEALATALSMRNLSLAEKYNREMVVPCVACFSRLKAAQQTVMEHPEYHLSLNKGNVVVCYALDFLCDVTLSENIKVKLVKSLTGLKVACYYGCLATRPSWLKGVQADENPEHMDRLMENLGAKAVPWSYKTECCGASLALTRTDIVIGLSQRILSMAIEAGAECIVTGCTMCHANLDSRQEGLPLQDEKTRIPVFYYTELMGLAMGHRDVKKWLSRHITDPIALLTEKGLL